jgi:hypothetical protein
MKTIITYDTIVNDLSPDSRSTAIARFGEMLGKTQTERRKQQAALNQNLTLEQQAQLKALLDLYGYESTLHQAINDLMALTNHETRLSQTLISQINGYRTRLGMPTKSIQREVGTTSWAASYRSLTTEEIKTRIHRELLLLREKEKRQRQKVAQTPEPEPTPRRQNRHNLLEHFRRRLKSRYGIELSQKAIEIIDEQSQERPTIEVTNKGSKMKLLEINGQSVWAIVTRSSEGKMTLTTVLTYNMVAQQAYARGDSIPAKL